MALVIEDGTVVAGANSYIDVDTAKSYANARGVNLGTDDELIERRLVIAMDYLETLNYKGVRTNPAEQELAWPRTGVIMDGIEFDGDVIPARLRNAQAQLVIEQTNGVAIFASTGASAEGGEKFVKREKVDVIETEYATPKELGTELLSIAKMPAVDALLRGLIKSLGPLFAYRG